MSYFVLFLFLILVLFIVLATSGGRILTSILKVLLGRTMQTQGSMGNNGRGNKQNSSYTNNQSHKKVFSKDEGEYVDFEEIKE